MSYITNSESDMDSASMVNSDHKHSPRALSTEGVASSPRKLQTGKISPNKPQLMVNENICSASSNDTTYFWQNHCQHTLLLMKKLPMII